MWCRSVPHCYCFALIPGRAPARGADVLVGGCAVGPPRSRARQSGACMQITRDNNYVTRCSVAHCSKDGRVECGESASVRKTIFAATIVDFARQGWKTIGFCSSRLRVPSSYSV